MITDPQFRTDIAQQWAAIRVLCQGGRQYAGPRAYINETWPDSFLNLPLVLAYSALGDALKEMNRQYRFYSGDPVPKEKMQKSLSVPAIKWQNYTLVDRGRRERNRLAHEAKLLAKTQCLELIGAIEAELKAWGAL